MANIWIQNNGVYSVSDGKVQDLLQWLKSQGAVNIEGANLPAGKDGKELLNEDQSKGPHSDAGSPPQGDPNKTYDFGTTWI